MTPPPRLACAVLLLSVVVFALLATAALLIPTHAFELTLRTTLVRLDDGGPLSTFLRIIDNAGTWRAILPGTLVVFAVFPHARAHWWIWTVALLSAPAAETFFKFVIGRPRPEDLSMGFPSGHATAAAAFFGALIYLAAPVSPGFRGAVRIIAAVCIVLVGIARVALRAHWPSDAVGGIALGFALASMAQLVTGARWGATPDPHLPTRADPEPTRPPS